MIDYQSAGVNIDAGNEIITRIKASVKQTFDRQVIGDLGGFAALYDLQAIMTAYQAPLLVQSMDGVGTKTILATMMQHYDTLGDDLLSATANDIIVCGAKPLTLLDYVGGGQLNPDVVVAIIQSLCRACAREGVALVGGETAEMPGIYQGQEYTLVGLVTGVVEKTKVVTGKTIQPGDVVLGFASTGLHTNGYSLARKLCFDVAGHTVDSRVAELGTTSMGEILLTPHRNYTKVVLDLLEHFPIKGMAHITGGGLIENIPRILPAGCSVQLQAQSWPCLPIFDYLVKLGSLRVDEAYRTFNMGIGFVLVVDKSIAPAVIRYTSEHFQETPYPLYTIGEVVAGAQQVTIQ